MNEITKISDEQFKKKITLLNCILSVGIVFIHAYNVNVYNLSDSFFGQSVNWLEKVSLNFLGSLVPFFFLISGFLFFRYFTPSAKGYYAKIKSRFRSLFIPYLIFSIFGYIYFLSISNIPFIAAHMNMEPVNFSITVFIKNMWSNDYSIILWYVRNLIVMVVLSPFVWLIMKNHKKTHSGAIILTVSFLVSMLVYLNYTEASSVFQINRLLNNTYFFIGAFIAINHKDWAFYTSKFLTTISTAVFSLCIICMLLFDFFDYNNVLKNCLIIISAWIMSNNFHYKEVPKYLQISFFTYCIHEYLLEPLEKLWLIVGGRSALAALIDFLLIPILCLFVILCLSVVLRKYVPKFWAVITGKR